MLKLQVTYNTNFTQSHIWYKQFEHYSKKQSHIGGVGPRTKTKYFWRIINIEDRSPWRCGRRRENQNFELKKTIIVSTGCPILFDLNFKKFTLELQIGMDTQQSTLLTCIVLCFVCLSLSVCAWGWEAVCVCVRECVCLSVCFWEDSGQSIGRSHSLRIHWTYWT
jgi:hypothetical protein